MSSRRLLILLFSKETALNERKDLTKTSVILDKKKFFFTKKQGK